MPDARADTRTAPRPDSLAIHSFLDFEKPVADLAAKIRELSRPAEGADTVDVGPEIARLEAKRDDALRDLYAKLTPWQRTQVARHPDRPHFCDYRDRLFTEWTELAGDRKFAEDAALPCGFARIGGRPVLLMGQERGHDTPSRLRHNFGSARPEGYRKAVRLMELADRHRVPVVSLVDTAGAYPGVGAEERGQAEAIARATQACLRLGVPIVTLIIGEGGSGGAIAIATANRVHMLENAIYSVISPEGAASILWRDAARAKDAATAMKITAQDLEGLRVIDGIVPEPPGGAHRHADTVIEAAGETIRAALDELAPLSPDELRRQRREKYVAIGRTLAR